MMPRRFTLLALALLIGGFAGSAAPHATNKCPNCYTGGILNGRAWLSMNNSQRSMYLTGFADGIKVSNGGMTPGQYVCRGCWVDEMRDGVTRVYTDPATRPLPIAQALQLYILQANGLSKKEYDEKVSEYLSQLNQPSK